MKPSKAMIPGEIMCSAIGLVLAFFGGFGDGWLNQVLIARDEHWIWTAMLGIPALGMVLLSGWEWIGGAKCGSRMSKRFPRWRGRLVAIQGLCWLYAVYFGFDSRAEMIGSIGVVGFAFCAWSYWENRRVTREIRNQTAALFS